MSKDSDMVLATRTCRWNLQGVAVANPVGAEEPSGQMMASSIATAALAKFKVGKNLGPSSREYILEVGKATLSASSARCDQFGAAVCYLLNREPGFMSSIELLGNGYFGKGSHCWVLCGRDRSHDIRQVHLWGDDAFTIDVWLAKQHRDQAYVIPEPMQHDWNLQQASKIIVLQSWP